MQNTPDIWEKTGKFLFLSGYLTYVLTDEFTDSVGCTVGYIGKSGQTEHLIPE
jgi:sugar (pentulose or hexulose) kinase